MAQITKPAIPMKMYRHFAAVTVVLTAILAFTAQNQDEVAEVAQEITAPAPSPTPSAPSTPRYGQVNFSAGDGGGGGGAGGMEFDPTYGRPMDGSAARGWNTTVAPPPNSENAGFTDQYLNSLSEEELAQLLQSLRDGGVENEDQRRQITAVLEASSRRRSGYRERRED